MTNDNLPVVSIITVNYNGRRFLDTCFNSLLSLNYPKELVEIVMVDNGSSDDSIRHTNEVFPTIKVVRNDKNNYSQANNLGIRNSRGKFVVFINNDVEVEREWLIELVRCAEADALCGAVGSKILFRNGQIQSLGLTQYTNFYWGDLAFNTKDGNDFETAQEIVAVSGCSALYRRSCLDAIGGFDEDFNMYLEDVDLGIRCRHNGWKVIICPKSVIYHEFHGTIGVEENARKWQEANRLLLVAKYWPDKLVEALQYGRGYFISLPGALREKKDKELSEALERSVIKISNTYGREKADKIKNEIMLFQQNASFLEKPSLLEELSAPVREIKRRDEYIIQLGLIWERKDGEIKVKDTLIDDMRKRIEVLERRIIELNNISEKNRSELSSIYTSTGYRYLLKPLWNIIFSFKRSITRILLHIKKFKEVVQLSYGGNSWKEAYFKHLKYATFPPIPETAVLMLTKRCNLHCVFCDIANINEDMKLEDAQKVIDNIARLKATLLVITGGEPFLHPCLFDVVKYAKNKGLKVCITTNGTLIDENFEKISDSKVDVLSVSLDGLGAVHDTLRNKPGLAEKVKASILRVKKLEAQGQSASINFVITNKNLGELESVYQWAKQNKIFMDFWPVNFHPELHINISDEYAKLRKFIEQLKSKGELSPEKYNYFLNASLYCGAKQTLRVRCLALIRNFGIDVDGSVRICCVWGFKHDDLGNAIRDNLEGLWHSSKYHQARRALYYHGCSAGCYNNALHQFTAITGKDYIVSAK